MRRWGCSIACAALLALLAPATAGAALPPIKHVFIVILENQDMQKSFGKDSKAPYLARTLRARGAFVPGYFGTGHESLDNYVSLVSGQGPNAYTQADAPLYINFMGSTGGPNGQAIGVGSVYPSAVPTVGDQLAAKGATWGGYMEDMGKDPARDGAFCNHGHPSVGAQDKSQSASKTDQYAMRHNPFMYFHSIIDNDAQCAAHVHALTALSVALTARSATPNYVFVSPDLCHDAHDANCADGGPGGMPAANGFLKKWIPAITSSPAYRHDGLLIVTFDESASGADACCGEMQGPNAPNNGGPDPGAGGGQVGAVLLSRYIKPGTGTEHEYNHYSLLRSVEDIFGLSHLGYAGVDGLRPFGSDIFTNPSGRLLPAVRRPRVRFNDVPRHGCVSGEMTVRVRTNAAGPRTVTVKLDGHRVKRSHKLRFSFTIHAASLSAGKHRLFASATDRFGRHATRRRTFHRCGGGG